MDQGGINFSLHTLYSIPYVERWSRMQHLFVENNNDSFHRGSINPLNPPAEALMDKDGAS